MLAVPTGEGIHYYFARALGTPEGWWTPTFVIEVMAGQAAFSIPAVALQAVGGQLQMQFATEPGASYRIQQSPTLAPDSWTDMETVAGDGDPVSRTLPVPGGRAFYRVVVE